MEDIGWFNALFCQVRKGETALDVERACAKMPGETDCFVSPENNMNRVSCLGGRSRTTLLVEHYLHVRADHEDVPSFGFLHDYDLHIDNLVALNMYDGDKAQVISMLAEADVLKDTIVIFLSDHGSQREITATSQGKSQHQADRIVSTCIDT